MTTTDELMELHEAAIDARVRLRYGGTIEAAKAADEALRTAIQEVVEDMERLDWLAVNMDDLRSYVLVGGGTMWFWEGKRGDYASLREAIDAAIRNTASRSGG